MLPQIAAQLPQNPATAKRLSPQAADMQPANDETSAVPVELAQNRHGPAVGIELQFAYGAVPGDNPEIRCSPGTHQPVRYPASSATTPTA